MEAVYPPGIHSKELRRRIGVPLNPAYKRLTEANFGKNFWKQPLLSCLNLPLLKR